MDANMTAKFDALGVELARTDSELRAELKELADQADIDVDTVLNPPVQVVCGLDGAVAEVDLDQKRCASMTGQELGEAIHQASRRPRYAAPPLEPGGSPEQQREAMMAQGQTMLEQAEALIQSAQTVASAQEVSGMNSARTVTVTYRGRFLAGVECNQAWLDTASPAQIQDAVAEASRVALQTVRTAERRR